MAVFAAEKMYSPAEMSLPSQAQKMARDIDSAKTLAYTSGKRMSLTITEGANGTYAVTCVTAPTPCDTDFSVTLQKGVVLAVVSPTPNPLQFSSLGQPSAADTPGERDDPHAGPAAGTSASTGCRT